MAHSLNNIGAIYHGKSQLDRALEYCQQALEIRKRQAPDSLDLAHSLNNIGAIYHGKGQLDRALEYCQQALEIRKRQAPDSSDLTRSLGAMGEIYFKKGLLNEALNHLSQSLKIIERDAPGSLSFAYVLNVTGEVYKAKKELDQSLLYHQKALEIRKKDAPESLVVSKSLNDIGNVYQDKGQLDMALKYCQESLNLRLRLGYLVDNHPDLIKNHYNIAEIAYKLGDYKKAIEYGEETIKRDKEYKFAYNILGQALIKEGKLNRALRIFDEALEIDPDYDDVAIHKIELLSQIAQKEQDMLQKAKISQQAVIALNAANNTKISNFNQNLIEHQKQNAQAGAIKMSQAIRRNSLNNAQAQEIIKASADVKIELPKEEYEHGSKKREERLNQLEDIIAKLTQNIAQNTQDIKKTDEKALSAKYQAQQAMAKVEEVEIRVDRLEDRFNILDGRIYKLEDSINIVEADIKDINHKISQNQHNQPLLNDLAYDLKKANHRKDMVKYFNQNPDLADYYHSLLTEINSFYIAALAVKSEQVDKSRIKNYSKVTDFIAPMATLLPAYGELASKLISATGYAADLKTNIADKRNLLRLCDLTPSMAEFDQIAMRLAIMMTNENLNKITKLNKEQVPTNWKSYLNTQILSDGIEGIMTKNMSDNQSKAALLGKIDAHQIIKHLQEPRVAENLKYKEDQDHSTPNYKRKESIIAQTITSNVKQNIKQKQTITTNPQLSASVVYTPQQPQTTQQQPSPITSTMPHPSAIQVQSQNRQANSNSICSGCAIM